ncbi:hypothetical protein E2C01_046202 [Portunus trituberculatus]|uniref:Uncharacterized protein n=1 Tax=Portunus trituberculatus TaxID=210409 RepID=A0A5B7G418_PORTR|nr:hypothetical protein [Portunus trituberculatus]
MNSIQYPYLSGFLDILDERLNGVETDAEDVDSTGTEESCISSSALEELLASGCSVLGGASLVICLTRSQTRLQQRRGAGHQHRYSLTTHLALRLGLYFRLW